MKTSGAITILRFMISFFLVATTAFVVVAGENELVLDIHGKPVKANTPYYIYNEEVQSSGKPPRIGLTRLPTFSRFVMNPCPEIVAYKATEYAGAEPPTPFIFLSSSDFVRVSTELNIRFALPSTDCKDSEFWTALEDEKPWEPTTVAVSGSKARNESTFIINKSVRHSDSYSFAFGSAGNSTNILLDRPILLGVQKLIVMDTDPYDFQLVPASAL